MKSPKIFPDALIRFSVIIILLNVPPAYSQTESDPLEETPSPVSTASSYKTDIEMYTLEELLDVQIEVASLFAEDELVVGSTVSSINSERWKQLGARRMYEALNNEMSVHTTPNLGGMYNIAIRGYTNSESRLGIATLIDGIPVNLITLGSPFEMMPNCELGILDKIELIKGPGSSIYGSDAFHGVLLLKTFESDHDHYSVEGAGAYPLYGDGNIKLSHGLWDDIIRIDAAVSLSHRGDRDLEYKWEDNGNSGTGKWKNKYDSRAEVFKIRIKPVDKLKIKLRAYHTDFDGEQFPGPHEGQNQINLEDKDHSSNNAQYNIANGLIEYTFENKISIELSGYYSKTDLEMMLMASPDNSIIQYGDVNQTGANITIKQPVNPLNLQWLIAYSFNSGKIEDNYYELDSGYSTLKDDLPAKGFTRTIKSAFSQLKWGILQDRLYLLLGARVDNYQDSGSDENPEDFGNQFSPRAGIIFLPAKNSSIKALYGRAFKAPNNTQLFGFPYVAGGNMNLEPEKIDVYELTYIYKAKKWKINLTGFYSLWKNAIVADRRSGKTIYVNKGKNDSIGGEMNLFKSLDPFIGELGFSYVSSRALDIEDPVNNTSDDIHYHAFPEYSIQAGIHYRLMPLNINFYLNNRVYLNMKETNEDLNPDPEDLPQYHRMDLNISKIIADKSEIYLDVRNIFNRENKLPSVCGVKDGIPESGTSIMLRASYKL